MTLHTAIEKLLRDAGRSMTTQEIADELNKNRWYHKKNGSSITAFQIHGRTKNYSQVFNRNGATVSLVAQEMLKPDGKINRSIITYTSRTIPTLMHANCGHGEIRRLEDCFRLNFISAGQEGKQNSNSDTFGRQIRNLIKGDLLAVYRNKIGYVGIAQVVSDPMDINTAILGGQKVTPEMFSKNVKMFRNHDNANREWLVEVVWLTKVHLGEKIGSGICYGVFQTQHVTCSLKKQLTLKSQLQENFRLNFEAILNTCKSNLVQEIVGFIAEEDDEISFREGKEIYNLHKSKERNRELIRLAKERHYKNDEKLCCQVCGFSFVDTYGEIGHGFIEAHHVFPISQLTAETETRIEDLALVCSNCHRMLHRKRPWLTIDNLKAIRQQSD